ncbi:MAG TPA: hypothetical protein VE378_00005, partial [Nitrososphaeraceae archaeon]|nr:hypothetical protein [Nitrososphaeraceae archaeon]
KGNSKQVTRTTTTIMLALAAVLTMNVLNNNSLSTIIPAFADGKDHHDGKDRDGKDHGGKDHGGKDHDGKDHKGKDSIPTVVTIPLEGLSLNEGNFLLLSDTTPVRVGAAHLAINVPCTENGDSDIVAVAGVKPDLDVFALEPVPELSAPPTNCLFHIDIVDSGIEVTDIAIANLGADIQFGSGNFATLSITEVDKFEYGHMQYPGINP